MLSDSFETSDRSSLIFDCVNENWLSTKTLKVPICADKAAIWDDRSSGMLATVLAAALRAGALWWPTVPKVA
jgi:hypothetical protein